MLCARSLVAWYDYLRLQSHDLIDGLVPLLARFVTRHAEINVIENDVTGDHSLQRWNENETVSRFRSTVRVKKINLRSRVTNATEARLTDINARARNKTGKAISSGPRS